MIAETALTGKGVAKGGRAIGYASGGVAAASLALKIAQRIPEGHAALRVHNHRVTRSADSWAVPEWKAGTIFGRYSKGWTFFPPLFQHMELISLMDRSSLITTRAQGAPKKSGKSELCLFATKAVWGVPREFDEQGNPNDFGGRTYDTVLVNAMTKASNENGEEKILNDQVALNSMVVGICTSGLTKIVNSYKKPLSVPLDDYRDRMIADNQERLLEYGVELRDFLVMERTHTDSQKQYEGFHEIAEALGRVTGSVAVVPSVIPTFGEVPIAQN